MWLAESVPGDIVFALVGWLLYIGPVIVLAAIIWLVHTIWKYRHIPPRRR